MAKKTKAKARSKPKRKREPIEIPLGTTAITPQMLRDHDACDGEVEEFKRVFEYPLKLGGQVSVKRWHIYTAIDKKLPLYWIFRNLLNKSAAREYLAAEDNIGNRTTELMDHLRPHLRGNEYFRIMEAIEHALGLVQLPEKLEKIWAKYTAKRRPAAKRKKK